MFAVQPTLPDIHCTGKRAAVKVTLNIQAVCFRRQTIRRQSTPLEAGSALKAESSASHAPAAIRDRDDIVLEFQAQLQLSKRKVQSFKLHRAVFNSNGPV